MTSTGWLTEVDSGAGEDAELEIELEFGLKLEIVVMPVGVL